MIGHQGQSYELHYAAMLTELVKLTGCEVYLELGIYSGTTLDKIRPHVKRAIGVDIMDVRVNKTGEFFLGTTDDFFKIFRDPVDMVFIDAEHTFEAVKRDFENSLRLLTKNGIILFHDVDPLEKKLLAPTYCGDCHRIIDHIQYMHPEMNIISLPITDAGMALANRKSDRRVLSFLN